MGKNLVVTGGTKGIGKSLVKKFVENGYSVITCSRSESNVNAMLEEFAELDVKALAVDLSSKSGCEDFISFVNNEFDQVDVLVNNTGIFLPGAISEEEEGALEAQINTNLYSAYRITRGFIGKMKERKAGDIFNICSIASITAYPNGGSYSISKFAMYGMTKVLREEMKEYGVRVSAVLPGAVLTSSWDGTELPPERFIQSEDIADTIWAFHNLSKGAVVEDIVIRPQLGDI